MDKVVGKIIVLREICEHKSVLFGPFGEEISAQRKLDIWNKVLNKAKSLGLVSYDKDYKYMRDVYWQNIKRGALGKKGNANKSGREKKYSPIDDLVFEILEKSTAPVPPMPTISETFTAKEEEHDCFDPTALDPTAFEPVSLPSTKQDEDINHNQNVVYLEDPETTSPVRKTRKRTIKSKFLNEELLRKKKMKLQLEYMEIQNYKMKLEVLEIEQKLGINPSKYTKEIAKVFNRDSRSPLNNVLKDEDVSEQKCDSDD